MKNFYLEICKRSYPYYRGTLCAAASRHFHHFNNRIFPSENPVKKSILCNRTLCTVIVYTKNKNATMKTAPNAIYTSCIEHDNIIHEKLKFVYNNKINLVIFASHMSDLFFSWWEKQIRHLASKDASLLNKCKTCLWCFDNMYEIHIFNR